MLNSCSRCKRDYEFDTFKTCPQCRKKDRLRKQGDSTPAQQYEINLVRDKEMIDSWLVNNKIKDLDNEI